MILLLVVILIFIDVGLRLSIVGMEVSFFVGERLNKIRKGAEDLTYKSLPKGKLKKALGSVKVAGRTLDLVVGTGLSATKKLAKKVVRGTISVVQSCVKWLWKILLSFAIVWIVVDIIVFFIVVAIAYYMSASGYLYTI